jgi:hypothetical protein
MLLALAACTARKPPAGPTEPPPDLSLTRVTVREYKGSATQLIATAPKLWFDRAGPSAGRLTATEVVADSRVNGVHLELTTVTGDALNGSLTGTALRATTTGGAVLTSPVAHFEQHEGEGGVASTDAGVHLDSPTFTLDAQRASFDFASEKADLEPITTVTK